MNSPPDYSRQAAKVMFSLRDLIEDMVAGGNVDPEKFQYQIMARKVRKQVAKELKEKGLSTRQIAKITGADHSTIVRDLNGANAPDNGANAPTQLFPEHVDPIQEHCEDCETPAEHWQRSLENLAGDALSVRAYWKRHFGDWETFDVPSTVVTLATNAAREWTQLARDLKARRKKTNEASS